MIQAHDTQYLSEPLPFSHKEGVEKCLRISQELCFNKLNKQITTKSQKFHAIASMSIVLFTNWSFTRASDQGELGAVRSGGLRNRSCNAKSAALTDDTLSTSCVVGHQVRDANELPVSRPNLSVRVDK